MRRGAPESVSDSSFLSCAMRISISSLDAASAMSVVEVDAIVTYSRLGMNGKALVLEVWIGKETGGEHAWGRGVLSGSARPSVTLRAEPSCSTAAVSTFMPRSLAMNSAPVTMAMS